MRRAGCCPFTLLLFVLSSCGGSDSPAAPTQRPPPTVTPIVVTVTAQVVDNGQSLARRGLTESTVTENRNVRVTGAVSVVGGSATAETTVTFTPQATSQADPIEVVAFATRTITPDPGNGTPFAVDIPCGILPMENAGGTVRVEVTGSDERGGTVSVSTELSVTADNTLKPAGTCIEDDRTACLGDGRFGWAVEWLDADGTHGPGIVTIRNPNSVGFAFVWSASNTDPDSEDLVVLHQNSCASVNEFGAIIGWDPNVGFTLTATDTQTNQTRDFVQPLGEAGTEFIRTFATCP